MSKLLTVIFSVVIIASLICAGFAYTLEPTASSGEDIPGLTIVRSPEQAEPEYPEAFPDPRGNWVKLPKGTNLAAGKVVTSGDYTEVYAPTNITDEDVASYWESSGFPAEITIDLEEAHTIQTLAVRLNSAPNWEARTQGFEVHASTDGTSFSSLVPSNRYEFNPDTGNIVRIDFDPVSARYVRLIISENSSGRSKGGQVSEIEVYE